MLRSLWPGLFSERITPLCGGMGLQMVKVLALTTSKGWRVET